MTQLERDVTELVLPLIEPLGLHLYDLEHHGGVLRVLVDAEGGADIDQITRATRAISRALDDDDTFDGRYTLEVSSPGLERPLRRPEHYASAIGTKVTIKRVAGVEGDRRITGLLLAADDEGLLVRLDDVSAEDASPGVASTDAELTEIRVPMDEIDKARTVFEWGPAPKPGAAGRKPGTQNKRVTTS